MVEKDGEMPDETPRSSQPVSRRQTPAPLDGKSSSHPAVSSQPHTTVDDTRPRTPEPIKVVRSKKTGTGKKKRTLKPDEGSGTVTPN